MLNNHTIQKKSVPPIMPLHKISNIHPKKQSITLITSSHNQEFTIINHGAQSSEYICHVKQHKLIFKSY